MAVNYPSLVEIAISDWAPTEVPDSEEFPYQVDEEVGDDFDNDHEGNDVAFNCIKQAPSTHLSVIRCAFSQSEEKKTIREGLQSSTCPQNRRQ